MKCHYEILGVDPDCTSDDLKKAYRKLALEWHPDKNLHRSAEATEIFRLIQQAYEILIDPQERAWYDRHKDDILRGSSEEVYKDDCLNVYQYFNASCFKGYNDDEKGFYTVYRHVFETVSAEDRPFMENDELIPQFGDSTSSYEEVVHVFYAYWQSYCTSKTYSWMDQFNICDARKSGAGRQIIRMMEKENKKLRDQQKKSRNEEIRELVNFVRKRDKRIQAQKKISEEKRQEKMKKFEEQRKQQQLERNKELENYQESEWMSSSRVEEKFKEIENHLDNTYGAVSSNFSDEEEAADDDDNQLYCPACEKDFRSLKAMKNHENSKKHKENVVLLQYLMEEEDQQWNSTENPTEGDDVDEPLEDDHTLVDEVEICTEEVDLENEVESSEALLEELIKNTTKSKKKKKKSKPIVESTEDSAKDVDIVSEKLEEVVLQNGHNESQDVNTGIDTKSTSKKKSEKKKVKKSTCPVEDENLSENTEDVEKQASTKCEKCNKDFNSRNRLFAHLKESGHAIYKSENDLPQSRKKQRKKIQH